MNTTELRALAETLEHECALRLIAGGKNHEEAQACEQAADYLRQCADAVPVAWLLRSKTRRNTDGDLFIRGCYGAPRTKQDYEFAELDGDEYIELVARPAPAAPQAEKHPDDAAVDRFAAAMKSKLAEKRRQGKSGWDDPRCPTEYLAALLHEHVVKGDPLDVGNFAMMLWCRGGSTNETQAEPKRPIIEVITEFDDIANWYGVILVVGETRHRFFMDYYSMQLADAEDYAERLRKTLGITGDSDAD